METARGGFSGMGHARGYGSLIENGKAGRNHKSSRGFVAVLFREDVDAEHHGIQRAAMDFVLQLLAGDDGVAVGFGKFNNVVEGVHDRIRPRKDAADSTTDLIVSTLLRPSARICRDQRKHSMKVI
jgi:hypothetical protein